MAYTERRIPGESSQAPVLPKLSSHELARVAGDHLTDLIDHEHRTASERPALSLPRSRHLGRTIALGVVSIRETFGSVWRWLTDPRHITGRLIARPRLWAPSKTFNLWSALLLGFLVLMGYLRFFVFEGPGTTVHMFGILTVEISSSHEPWKTVTGGLFGATLIALLVLLWNDLIRLPYLAWKVRHRIIPRPERVLLPNLLAREARPLIEQIALEIVPRTELYEDLLPGVLVHGDKDVQIVMGDAGAGKTTALIAIAQLLAQNGIVPVLVPLRGQTETTNLIEPAKTRFKEQVEAQVRSQAEADLLWRWLMLRRRVAILVDDIDQVGPDGERGLVLRKMLDEASGSGLPVIVTARTAGVPAGIAASAIDLGSLGEGEAIDHVFKRAQSDPSFTRRARPSRRRIGEWVSEGRFVEVPFYLELLAGLAAVGACPRLPQASSTAGGDLDTGRVYQHPDGEWVWNKLWVRFNLLEHYCEQLMLGNVKRSLGIQPRERRNTLQALEGAALGMLVANSLSARMKLEPREGSDRDSDRRAPLRTEIEEFILTDDRSNLQAPKESQQGDDSDDPAATRRKRVSAHEAIDAGERMGILDRRIQNEPTAFHHRIMQAYLAARCLVVREYEAERNERAGGDAPAHEKKRINPMDRMPERERDWIAALLDHRHPDRLTAQMTLAFTAMRARIIAERLTSKQDIVKQRQWNDVGVRIVEALVEQAKLVREGKQTEDDSQERDRMLVTLVTESEAEATQLTLALSPERAQEAAVPPGRRKAALPDPLYRPDFEQRSDPDDALMKLTTAAEIVRAVPVTAEAVKRLRKTGGYKSISEEIKLTPGPTRWTKLRAIEALAVPADPDRKKRTSKERETVDALGDGERWHRIWEFARDADYDVKRGASAALETNAFESFKSLAPDIEKLIARAAARSSYGRWLVRPERADGRKANGSPSAPSLPSVPALLSLLTGEVDDLPTTDLMNWKVGEHVDALKALGAIMPAIVSGFREDPSIELESSWPAGDEESPETRANEAATNDEGSGEREANEVMCHHPPIHSQRLDYARRARSALEALVALGFEGRHGDLEAAVAQGFRSDALRHAQDPRRGATGPGWVMSNRQLVAGICLDHTTFWYARLVLYQTLALYAIAGADAQETLDILAWHTRRGGRDHQPFTRRTARLARAALRRHQLHSGRWLAYVWGDEGTTTSRRASQLTKRSAQLLADVTILLNLNQSAAEERQDAFVQMQGLPYCLSGSHDRSEILGEGCPPRCGWNLCPYRQAPPDEPDGYRGVRRSFCRQQNEIARRHRPRWQRSIGKKKLREFWREMELRART